MHDTEPRLEGGVPIFGPGDVIADKFRVERFVGEGGMAFVLEATHLELDERVALKFIHPSFRKQDAIVARFRAEARASARMKGEHIARVMDVSATHDGHPFIVMEFLDGEDLGRVLERRPLPDRADAIGWVIETCEALAEAHANGIVHRDVKPENLFLVARLGGRKVVKLLDFGISKLALTSGNTASSGVHAGISLIGTPSYMAPEQIRSAKNADPRSDQWSIGAVLYELLSGRLPFEGPSVADVCKDVLESPHRPIESVAPNLEPGLSEIVDRCLQKDAAARFPSVGDLALALMPFTHPRHHANVERMIKLLRAAGLTSAQVASIPPPPLVPSGPPLEIAPTSVRANTLDQSGAAELPSPRVPEKPNPAIKWAALALLLVALLGVALFLVFRGEAPSTNTRDVASEPRELPSTTRAAPSQTAATEAATEAVAPVPTGEAAPSEAAPSETARSESGRSKVSGRGRPAPKPSDKPVVVPNQPSPLDIKLER